MRTHSTIESAMRVLVWLLGPWLASAALAIPSHYFVSQLHHTQWTATDGAPTGIDYMVQTQDGFLWLASSGGLFRFDGIEFERFRGVDGVGLLSQHPYTLFAAANGGLWIGHRLGGASFLHEGTLTNYGTDRGLPLGSVLAFEETRDGTVWAGTSRGLYRLEGNRWTLAGADWNLPAEPAEMLLVDRDRTLWLVSLTRIFYLRPGAKAFERLPVDTKAPGSGHMTLGPNGTAVYCTYNRSGLLKLKVPSDPENFVADWDDRRSCVNDWGRSVFDREGHLWVGSNEGAGRYGLLNDTTGSREGDLKRYRSDLVPLAGVLITSALEDLEGNIWFAGGGGLDRFRAPALIKESFGTDSSQEASALAPGLDEGVWVGTFSGNVYRLRRGGWEHFKASQLSGAQVDSLYVDRSGDLWMGGAGALWQLHSDGRWRGSSREGPTQGPDPSAYGSIRALTQDAHGAMWVAFARVGNFRVTDGKWTQWTGRRGWPTQTTMSLFTDDSGRIWFGYADGVIDVLDGEAVTQLNVDQRLRLGAVLSFAQQKQTVWVGSDQGLWHVKDGSLKPLHGERGPFPGVSGIAPTSDGDLWVGTSEGIVHIAAEEIRRALADPRHAVRHRLLNYLDGLPGPAVTVVRSGSRVWFGTYNGVVWADPAHIPRNAVAPSVILKSLIVDGASHDIGRASAMSLPANTRNLQISYTAPSLTIPERVTFRYRLEGHDADWQNVGSRREAYYTDLAPGHYSFRVIAANNDGVWNEAGARVDLVMPPTFLQSGWFTALWVTVLGVALWLLYLFRLRAVKARLRMRLEERMVERERIARELHDTFLQGVQGLMLRFQSAMERIPPNEPSRTLMEDALDRADRMLADGREAVTNLRTANGTSTDLANDLRVIGECLSKESGIAFSMSIEGSARELDPVVRQDVQRLAGEALTNAFRHSQATSVELGISIARKELTARVSDNGHGFDTKRSYEGHWGIVGMRERAKRMQAKLRIDSGAAGTTILLQVPARIAFHGSGRTKRESN